MPSALVPLANITLGSSASTVTFSSISGSYRDVMLIAQMGASTVAYVLVKINNDTGSNYNYVYADGDGTNASSTAAANQNSTQSYLFPEAIGTSVNGIVTAHFMDYSATDKHKTILSRGSSPSYGTGMLAMRWASTSAITSFVLTPTSGTFAVGSTFALYGVSA